MNWPGLFMRLIVGLALIAWLDPDIVVVAVWVIASETARIADGMRDDR